MRSGGVLIVFRKNSLSENFPIAFFFPVSAHDKIFFLHLIDVITDAVYCDVSYGFGCFFFGKNSHFQAASHDFEFWRLEPCFMDESKNHPKFVFCFFDTR